MSKLLFMVHSIGVYETETIHSYRIKSIVSYSELACASHERIQAWAWSQHATRKALQSSCYIILEIRGDSLKMDHFSLAQAVIEDIYFFFVNLCLLRSRKRGDL